jgi:N-methylhydantoinase A
MERVRVRVAVPKYTPRSEAAPATPRAVADARKGVRRVFFDPKQPVEAIVYERDGLDIGVRIEGPCVVEQFDATTIVPSGWSAVVDEYRNLVLERAGA